MLNRRGSRLVVGLGSGSEGSITKAPTTAACVTAKVKDGKLMWERDGVDNDASAQRMVPVRTHQWVATVVVSRGWSGEVEFRIYLSRRGFLWAPVKRAEIGNHNLVAFSTNHEGAYYVYIRN